MHPTLDLLSDRGLSSSILLTILIGLWVMLFFTETFGWLFVGVVVPGYLASVLVIQPTSALSIILEAFVSLGFARLLANVLSASGAWSPFFGRDRFFLIVLVSVLVRQVDQTLLLPWLDLTLQSRGLAELDLNDHFSSIGLVLVPLTANFFWKQRFGRGLWQFAVVLGLTYALLKWVLLPYTNLTSASLVILYEDSALNFVSNAKVYIIMISTALIASQVNLKYGWDFGGILVAALLALLWWTPQKVLTTLVEAVVLYALAGVLLKIPWIGQANLEGSRKLVAVFSLGFALKCLVALAIGDAFVGMKVTDLFSFGYLMSSILAVRMLAERSALKVLGPVVLVSVLGLGLSSLVGLELQTWVDKFRGASRERTPEIIVSRRLLNQIPGVLSYAEVARPSPSVGRPAGDEYSQDRVWRALARYMRSGRSSDRLMVDALARDAQMIWSELSGSEEPVYLLHPGETPSGAPRSGSLVLVRPGAHSGPVLVAHLRSQYPGAAAVAWNQCVASDCSALMLRSVRRDRASAQRELMELEALRSAAPLRHLLITPDARDEQRKDGQRQASGAEFAFGTRLGLDKQDQVRWLDAPTLLGQWLGQQRELAVRVQSGSLIAFLQQELAHHHRHEQHSQAKFDAWSDSELRVVQDRIAPSLLLASHTPDREAIQLQVAALWAQSVGMSVVQLPDCGRLGCVALVSAQGDQSLIWVLAMNTTSAVDLEVPRTRLESGSLEFAAQLWSGRGLRSLLVHTGTSRFDPTSIANEDGLFHAIHQALESFPSSGFQENLVFSIRGASDPIFCGVGQDTQATCADLVVGTGEPLREGESLAASLSSWLDDEGTLGAINRRAIADTRAEFYPYSGQQHLQLRYTRALGGKESAVLWLSPNLRSSFKTRRESSWLAMHQSDEPQDVPWLDETRFLLPPEQAPEAPGSWNDLLERVESLVHASHPQAYAQLRRDAAQDEALSIAMVRGARTGRLFLAVQGYFNEGCGRALVRLDRWAQGRIALSEMQTDVDAHQKVFVGVMQRARTLWSWSAVCMEEIGT